ncbi:MAG: FKBP-type peptidyl-prolyl cis-trans isomerase [Sphingopyxis sp.]
MTLSRRLSVLAATSLMAFAVPTAAQDAPTQQVSTAWLNRQSAALAERNAGNGWNVMASGLRWRRVAGTGAGPRPGPSDSVTVHYVGSFVDGSIFDSSVARGEPATFPLNRVIDGWTEGVTYMAVGDKVEFAIPYYLAYGAGGRGPIPGGATLFFTVELLGIGS